MPSLVVTYRNGSSDELPCRDMRDAYDRAARVSVNSERVTRIEINTGEGLRALWDATWTDESKRAGMKFPA